MELLYIWIDSYKNIHRQGFNFSPKYRFDFVPTTFEKDAQGNETVTGGNLTHTENKNFPDNFFGEEISNVTAIVGENGSGKSTLLEFIMNLEYINIYFDNGKMKYKFLLVYKHGNMIGIDTNVDTNINKSNQVSFIRQYHISNYELFYEPCIKFNNIEKFDVGNIHFAASKNFRKVYLDSTIKGKYVKGTPNQSLSDEKLMADLENNYFNFIENLIITNIVFFKNIFKDFFSIPDFIVLTVRDFYAENYELNGINNAYKLTLINNVYKNYLKENEKEITICLLIRLQRSVMFYFFIQYHNQLLEDNTYLELLDCFIDDLEKEDFVVAHELFFDRIAEKFKFQTPLHYYKDLPKLILTNISDKKLVKIRSNKLTFNNEQGIWDIIRIHTILGLKIFEFSWHFERKVFIESFNTLSFGQWSLLKLLAKIKYYSDSNSLKNETALILLIDEGELGLHPQWQKEYLKNLIDVLPKIFEGKTIQIILTSHSPFLVSDLPKENIIFLAKGEKGECLVKNSLNDMKQTFGANIHTLLTDSFFMQDKGLMGKFAEGKINDVINWLNDGGNKNITELAEKQNGTATQAEKELKLVQWLIKQIGEPIIRNQLQKMLDSRRLAKVETHDEKITYLENIVSSLQEQIDKLKKQQ